MAVNQENRSLSQSQERALAALVSQPTIALAAAQAKVGERTLYAWLATDETFKAEYLKLRREIINNAVSLPQKRTVSAVAVVISLMSNSDTPATVRLAAARTVLEMSFKALEFESLEERISKLEGKIEELRHTPNRNGGNTLYQSRVTSKFYGKHIGTASSQVGASERQRRAVSSWAVC
jgi:hypothetical protein